MNDRQNDARLAQAKLEYLGKKIREKGTTEEFVVFGLVVGMEGYIWVTMEDKNEGSDRQTLSYVQNHFEFVD